MPTTKEEANLPDFIVIGRRAFFFDGTVLPLISGGADDDEDEDENEDDDDEKDDKPQGKKKEADKTFSQQDVNAISAREKRAGRRLGREEFLKDLGFESEREAKEALAGKNKKPDKDADEELTKARQKAEEADSKRTAAEAKLAARDLHDKVVDALVDNGLTPKAARKASRLVDVDAEATNDEIKSAVTELKGDMPNLFVTKPSKEGDEDDTEDDDQGDGGGNRSNGGRVPDPGGPPRKRGKGDPTPAQNAHDRLVRLGKIKPTAPQGAGAPTNA